MKKMPWSRLAVIFLIILIVAILVFIFYKPDKKVNLAPISSGAQCSVGQLACVGTRNYANESCCYGAEGECSRELSGKPICVKACKNLTLTCSKPSLNSNDACCYGACSSCKAHF